MNIVGVSLRNFRSWETVDLAIEPGTTLLSGHNGAGKSSLVDAMLWALYGSTSSAESVIRRGTDEASVDVEVATESGVLIVCRKVRRSGTAAKVSLALSRELPSGEIESLSAATTTETQIILESALGVSREVLLASAFSTQFAGGAFTEAAPRDRKRILTDTMPDLALWQPLADQANAERKAALAAAAVARSQVEQLDGAAARKREADQRCISAHFDVHRAQDAEQRADERATALATEAEHARDARREHALAVATEREAAEAYAVAEREQAAAVEALEHSSAAAAYAPSVDDARALAHEAGQQLAETDRAHLRHVSSHQAWSDAIRELRAEGVSLRFESETGNCDRCGQPLAFDMGERIRRNEQAVAEAERDEPPKPDIAILAAARERAQAAQTRLAEAETIESLAGSIDVAQARVEEAKARATAAYARRTAARDAIASYEPSPTDVEADYQAACAAVSQARQAHSGAAVELARAEAAAQQAEREAEREAIAREQLAAAERDAVVAGILAAGFGPQGVPALIVDGVLGDLADEANRVLAELGSPIRCDLRSQRLTRDDRLVDTLDILALMDGQEAPYETLSGGERTRLALALRAALSRLLASKRGARVRLLVVDEPAGLDASGCEQLAAVLEEFVRASIFDTVILVTHQSELAEQIGRVIRVEKTPGGVSRLVESAAHLASPQFLGPVERLYGPGPGSGANRGASHSRQEPRMTLKLGKQAFTHSSDDLLFATYNTVKVTLPKVPATFGHEQGITWTMLANDKLGDCTCAGQGHGVMNVNHANGRTITFTDANAITLYEHVSGYKPSDPSSDQGAVVRTVLAYMKKTGMQDASGTAHKIGAYLRLEPGNTDQLFMAAYLFGQVGLGIQFPETAMDQFNEGKPWSVVKGAQIEGGHYIPAVAHRDGRINIVTWGKTQPMTLGFYRTYCDEAWAIISPEYLTSDKTPEGFDMAQLNADLAAL